MKKYKTEQLRNVGIISHGGAGKTTLTEALLFDGGAIDRLGRVDDGTTASDHDPDEVKRKISINASVLPVEWKDAKINVIDTPGFADFQGDVVSALRVADGAIVVVDAVGGVEVGTENVWGYADRYSLPRMVFVSKMDRENADFFKALDELKSVFGNRIVPIQVPIGKADSFTGVVDIVGGKAYVYSGNGKNYEEKPVPADLTDVVDELRAKVVEAAAESDEELLEKYFEQGDLSQEEVERGLVAGVKSGSVYPVLVGSGLKNIGMQPLLDAIVKYMPSPVEAGSVNGVKPGTDTEVERKPSEAEPFSALVFKTMADPFVGKLTMFRVYSGVLKSDSTVYNATKDRQERIGQIFVTRGKTQEPVPELVAGDIGAVAKLAETSTSDTLCDKDNPVVFHKIQFPRPLLSMAVRPKAKGDEDKVGAGLSRLAEEDPTLTITKNTETNELIMSGLGDVHLDVTADRLKRKFGAEIVLDTPKVPYRETIRSVAQAEGKHKKQTGGRGQYGHVFLKVEPLGPGEGFQFVDNIFGGAVPRQYIPAVEKGVREALPEGIQAGYPLVDIKVELYDGSFHPVDSSEMAFKIAAQLALRKACIDARPVILEPIMKVDVKVPENMMGDVIGDLNKKRGRILGMEPEGRYQIVHALVPQAEMFKYSIDLRSITGGRGSFSIEFDHYEEVPGNIAQQIIEESQKAKGKEE